ncbi:MAG: AMP-binding protein [Anaeromyxobacter sp.]|nr:AMP-binding protein [Anaeromyxobacter sp.]MBL0276235.1 AMP-binding protein [Anaeromyxobacter sp.]
MFQVKAESPYPRLAARWTGPGTPAPVLVEDTRETFGGLTPGDLGLVAPLVAVLRARLSDAGAREAARRALWGLLDTVRRRLFTQALPEDQVEPWLRLLLPVIREADYTFGELLRSREETDPKTVAIRVLGADATELTVSEVARRTRAIARGLLAILGDDPEARVAILSENCLEAALCDLACLSNGFVDFPLPANAVAEQIVYMLKHSRARVLLCSDEEQVAKVLPALSGLPDLREVVCFSKSCAERNGLLSLDQVVGQGAGFDEAAREARAARVKATDMATAMYTSGTTGKPKAIIFTHENIVSKRLCRGFALREVGEGDTFLCYLPLYHTFGRYLELTGTLWWGATYVFARSTAQATLLEDFRAVKPSVFISVPKKWMELQDAAVWEAASDDPDETAAHLRVITGTRLRYGLSAAGYLDPAIFKNFHRAGVELCSGYGMTEATGGITMTVPGGYVDGSIGTPLPGVECHRADDGELLIRGVYISPGYLDPGPEEAGSHDPDGWFHTGDLVSLDDGHFRIVGRKKEIYKNRAGQTIAPQRVENLFRDFEAVAQAFLVGDHRDYNTLLVWPNFDKDPSLRERSPEQLRDLLSSLVASANRFLAPFERVVAFQVLPRALDLEHGELTHKASFKREVVEKVWKDLIEKMYEQKHLALSMDGMFLRIPNWVLREIGVLQHEVALRHGLLTAGERSIQVGPEPSAPGSMRLGDLAYANDSTVLDLGALLARPSLWLGNEALRAFLGDEAFLALVGRRRKGGGDLRIDPRLWVAPSVDRLGELLELVEGHEVTFRSIHAAGELLRAERPEARRAISHLHIGLAAAASEQAVLCRALLRRAADAPDEDVKRRAFRVLLPNEEPHKTLETLRLFLDRMGAVALRDEDLADLGERGLTDAQVQLLLAHLASDRANGPLADPSDRRALIGVMRLLTATAIAHPNYFARVRVPLARLTLHDDAAIAARAGEEFDRLRRGFSNWIGPNLRLAIDPQGGHEYGWSDVLAFEPSVSEAARKVLLQAVADSTLVRASVFLLGRGVLLSLADIPPGGATVSLLGRQHGKAVYRLSIHTRSREVFDLAINVAEDLSFAALREEVNWLLACGAPPPLVEQFGGYFGEWGIFSEEFIPGDDVERQVARLLRQGEARRLELLWPFVGWTALECLVRFWDRAGRRLALRNPSPAAFIVPSHDYHAGARLVSIADRSACTSLDDLLDRFDTAFLEKVGQVRPELAGKVTDEMILSAVVEGLGPERALPALEEAASGKRAIAVSTFLDRLRVEGPTPQRVFFAARRFKRWLEVNPQATPEAQVKHLGELWGTYRLSELEQTWPDTRIRFYRRTVLVGARPELGAALDRLMQRVRVLPAGGLDLAEQVAAIRSGVHATEEEDFLLAHMTYRYLSPGEDVALISMPHGGHVTTEVVVALTDEEGNRFAVRGPVSPREVARLLHLFGESNLQVAFATEHEFLLTLDAKEAVLGGLFYRPVRADRVHMEKLVISRKQRGKGVADGLMREFFRRMRARGVKAVETGYFQPEYLKRFGFRTDPGSGGLVRDLDAEDPFKW